MRTSPPTTLRELPSARVIRPQRTTDAQQIGTQPQRVTTLDGAGRIDPPNGWDAGRGSPRLEQGRLAASIRLAGTKRNGAAVHHEQGIEGVDEVGVIGFDVERVNLDAQLCQQVHVAIVLALRGGQVDREQKAMRRIVEGCAEGSSGTLDERLAHVAPSCSGRPSDGMARRSFRTKPIGFRIHRTRTATRSSIGSRLVMAAPWYDRGSKLDSNRCASPPGT